MVFLYSYENRADQRRNFNHEYKCQAKSTYIIRLMKSKPRAQSIRLPFRLAYSIHLGNTDVPWRKPRPRADLSKNEMNKE